MIRLDYWNHPLIVKAMRVKYRSGSLYALTVCYLLLLLMGGALMFRFQHVFGTDEWIRNYFLAMVSLQFILSIFLSGAAVASSMHNEVTTRTLDFQRIAAIASR